MIIKSRGSAIPSHNENREEAPDSAGARGALADEALSSIIYDNERVKAAFANDGGLSRLASGEEQHVSCTVVMAVTDKRILFVSGDQGSGGASADAGSVGYADVAAVSVEGTAPAVLSLSMANGVRWEFPLPDTSLDVVDSVLRHLRWVGEIRGRVVACRNDVELAAGEIRAHASEMNWIEAEDTYEGARSELDELISAVHLTEPIDATDVAPELTEIERTLERAYARLFIERAQSQLELGRQLVEGEDYEQAQPVLRTAYSQYERAKGRVDAVKRADEFRFGEDRVLHRDLDGLKWDIETVAAEPISQAHEAKIAATSADDHATAVEHWETAFQRYDDVLELELGAEDQYFTGNPERIRGELQNAADQLVECHRQLARKTWKEARAAQADGDVKTALRTGETARDHIKRAGKLASEFKQEQARQLEYRRQEIEDDLHDLRQRGRVTRTTDQHVDEQETTDDQTDSTEGEDVAQTEPDDTTEHLGAADALAQMDTHHDITLDTSIDGQTADGGRRRETLADRDDNAERDEETRDDRTGDEEMVVGPQRADEDDEHAVPERIESE